MTVILTDRMLEDLEFIGRNPWHPERMVCGPFDIERIDLSDEDIGLLEDIFGHGPMFAYYTLEYGTVPQLALAIKYLRYGKTIAFADRSQVRRFFDSYPVARVDISRRPLDRGVMPACRIRRDIIYVFTDSGGVAWQRDSDALSLMGEPYEFRGEVPWSPYKSEEGMTLSELVRRVGNLVNVVLTYRRGDVQPFIEEAMEADHPIWTDGIDPIDVQPAGSPPLFPDAVVHSYGIVPLFGIRHRGWTGFVSKDITELKDVRTKGSEDYKWDLMLLIAIVEEP